MVRRCNGDGLELGGGGPAEAELLVSKLLQVGL